MKQDIAKEVLQTMMGDEIKKIITEQVQSETENITKSMTTPKSTYQLVKFVLDKSIDLSLEYSLMGIIEIIPNGYSIKNHYSGSRYLSVVRR
jgi:hypothetical protein